MANVAKSAHRSSMTQRQAVRGGASGFHRAPGAFDHLVGMKNSSQQEYKKKNWHYMTEGRTRFAERLSTKMRTYAGELSIDLKTGQFGLAGI